MLYIDIGILIFLFIFTLGATWVYRPETWDWSNSIFENGISGTYEPFLPFTNIDKIIYGKMNDGSKFLQIISKNRTWNKCPDIVEDSYINDYYKQAVEILKQKCPNVPWVKMKWLEWKNNKDFI
jgi:hypothetical protein